MDDSVVSGKYCYMYDLQTLSGRVAPAPVPKELHGISTPLRAAAWEEQLQVHPDKDYVQYLLAGIQSWFRIGFDYSQYQCRKAKCNML